MRDNRPIWIKEQCLQCLGCLHRCLVFAIQYGKKTIKHGQFVHPGVKMWKSISIQYSLLWNFYCFSWFDRMLLSCFSEGLLAMILPSGPSNMRWGIPCMAYVSIAVDSQPFWSMSCAHFIWFFCIYSFHSSRFVSNEIPTMENCHLSYRSNNCFKSVSYTHLTLPTNSRV